MNIIPRFSFTYDGEPFDVSDANVTPTDYGFLYELSDGLCIELHRRDYPAYTQSVGRFGLKTKARPTAVLYKTSATAIFTFGSETKTAKKHAYRYLIPREI